MALSRIRADPLGQLMIGSIRGADEMAWLTESPVVADFATDLNGLADDDPEAGAVDHPDRDVDALLAHRRHRGRAPRVGTLRLSRVRLVGRRIRPIMTTNVTPRRPVNGKQVRADRTRAMVIDETVRCVLEEGFGAASAKHITERAGVTWGVIQYHFGDRDGLLMAVVDGGFSELLATLGEVEPQLGTHSGRARIELLVNTVAEAFLSPTSIAALEILIATRASRADVDQRHLLELFSTLTDLGRYVAEGLEPERADAVGNLVWTTLMGAMVATMAVPGPVDVSRELRALTDVITPTSTRRDAVGREITAARPASVRSRRRPRYPPRADGWRTCSRRGTGRARPRSTASTARSARSRQPPAPPLDRRRRTHERTRRAHLHQGEEHDERQRGADDGKPTQCQKDSGGGHFIRPCRRGGSGVDQRGKPQTHRGHR